MVSPPWLLPQRCLSSQPIPREILPQIPLVRIHQNDCFPAENLNRYRKYTGSKLLYQGYGETGQQFWVFRNNNEVDVLSEADEEILATLSKSGFVFRVSGNCSRETRQFIYALNGFLALRYRPRCEYAAKSQWIV